MPLTTLMRPDGRQLDSTRDGDWSEVITLVKPPLYCYECYHGMHCVEATEHRIRFFRHNPGRPEDCSRISARESPEHLYAKKLITDAVRALDGWTAEPERGGQGWVADVLATGPDGRRIAFEPQLSPMVQAWAVERTRRRAAAGVESVWLDGRNSPGMQELPWVRLHASKMLVTLWVLPPIGLHAVKEMVTVAQFAQAVCLGRLAWDGERFAAPGERAELERRREAIRLEQERREAERAEKARRELEELRERRRLELERAKASALAEAEEQRMRDNWAAVDPDEVIRHAIWSREVREREAIERQDREDRQRERWAREEAAAAEARRRHAELMEERREAALCPNCRERDRTPGFTFCSPCFYRPEYWHWSNRAVWTKHFKIAARPGS